MSATTAHQPPFLLGIDYGTESCRAAIIDAVGTPLAFASTPYTTSFPQSGWAEQRVEDWERALVRSTRRAVEEAGIDPAQIAGIGYDATSLTFVALDENDRPLRPAMMWMDVRATEQVARVPATLDSMKNPGRVRTIAASAEMFPFKAAWLKENEPEIYQRAAHLLDAPDWLGHKLTGVFQTNENSASAKMYHDRSIGGFAREFYAGIGCEDALEKVPHPVRPLGTHLGELTAAMAAELGLPAGIPVAEGCIDAYSGQIGLNVLSPGRMALITGSSHALLGQAPLEVADAGLLGAFADSVIPGQCTVEGALVSSGSSVRWFRDNFALDVVERGEQEGLVAYNILNDESKDLPPGSEGLIINPYFQGSRTPITDSKARAIIWGLSLSHTRAHVYHALQESICYSVAHNLRAMASSGYEVQKLVACGGALRSPAWIQMHADVTGVPITLTKVQDAVALGGCIMAAAAGGVYPSLADAAEAMVHETAVLDPDPVKHEQYKYLVDAYTETFPRLRDLEHDMYEHLVAARVE